jgi:hypothetical protein
MEEWGVEGGERERGDDMASLLMLIYQVFSKDLPFYKWKETSILRLVLSEKEMLA